MRPILTNDPPPVGRSTSETVEFGIPIQVNADPNTVDAVSTGDVLLPLALARMQKLVEAPHYLSRRITLLWAAERSRGEFSRQGGRRNNPPCAQGFADSLSMGCVHPWD